MNYHHMKRFLMGFLILDCVYVSRNLLLCVIFSSIILKYCCLLANHLIKYTFCLYDYFFCLRYFVKWQNFYLVWTVTQSQRRNTFTSNIIWFALFFLSWSIWGFSYFRNFFKVLFQINGVCLVCQKT